MSYHFLILIFVCSFQGTFVALTTSGDNEIRTRDLLLARQALSQLSYTPMGPLYKEVGLSGLEPPTSRLSGVRSNRLSYKPSLFSFRIRQPPTLPHRLQCSTIGRLGLNHRVRDGNGCYPQTHRHRKVLYSLL